MATGRSNKLVRQTREYLVAAELSWRGTLWLADGCSQP
jgi:hypothetical protein